MSAAAVVPLAKTAARGATTGSRNASLRPRGGHRGAAIATLLLVGPAAACDDLFIEPYVYGTVDVVATTRSGAPAEGVDLVLYTGTRLLGYRITGADGTARFDFVPDGALGVSVSSGLYRPENPSATYTEFRLSEGGAHTVRFTLLGPGALRVRVVDASNAPALGLRVQVYESTGTVAEGVVEGPEPLLFPRLGIGEYGVRALPGGPCTLPPDGFVYSDGHVVEEEAVTDVTLLIADC
jgi:hypothetical protein